MDNSYLCPYCRGNLKVSGHIVFSAKSKSGNRGILFFSPKLGDYQIQHNQNFNFSQGERLEILCPMCHANLTAMNVNKNLAEVILVDQKNDEYDIYFSEIVGEKCTYKIHNKDVETFGENSSNYMNFFGI